MKQVLALNRRKYAVYKAIRNYELEVSIWIVDEVVCLSLLGQRAVGACWTDVEPQAKVHHAILDLGVLGHAPVNLEACGLVNLCDRYREIRNLLLEINICPER
jgi:hypothetical protein